MKTPEYKAVKNLVINTSRIGREEIRGMVQAAVKEVVSDLIKDEAFRALAIRQLAKEAFGRGGFGCSEIRSQIAKAVMDKVTISVTATARSDQ